MKIEHNVENNTITVGKAVFTRFTNFKSRKAWVQTVLRDNGVSYPHGHPKTENKAVADALGCSAVQLYKHFCGLQMKVFVAPYYDILKRVSFSRGRIPSEALQRVSKHYTVLRPVLEDKLFNLLPIVAATGKSPQELKAVMKKKWKAITSNSLHRNKAIYHNVKNSANAVDKLTRLVGVSTTVLQHHYRCSVPVMEYLTNNFRGKWCKPLSHEARLFNDTLRMAVQLGEDASVKWTPRRVQEEHDRMAREITARRYSPEPFESCAGLPTSIIEGEYTATLLNSAQLVAQEGEAMGHCVAGYADEVRQGRYLVYSVTKEGQRQSTIGIHVDNSYKESLCYKFNQHYGRFNRRVEDAAEQRLAYTVIESLRKHYVDKCSQA